MNCLLCRVEPAALDPDPRLPLLQVETCWSCRDLIARDCGWRPGKNRSPVWLRGRVMVRLEKSGPHESEEGAFQKVRVAV